MKLRYILPVAVFASASLFTSCVKDLEVENINPQEVSDFNEDYIFNKIYKDFISIIHIVSRNKFEHFSQKACFNS